MFEKVNPCHPDKVADRIAGRMVDIAYQRQENPRIAVEVLVGHGYATVIAETSVHFETEEVADIVENIVGQPLEEVKYIEVEQDVHLADNQKNGFRCGDNGIFKGVPLTFEEETLSEIARDIYKAYPTDGKYVLSDGQLTICQSYAKAEDLKKIYPDAIINPLGDWTGSIMVDSGATNRKLGSDLAQSVTGGGLCLSSDSEFISNDYKWHKISEYNGELVGQWNNGKLEFVTPLKYIHNEKDDMIHIWNDSKLSMKLTPYHQILIKTSKGNLIKRDASIIADKLVKRIGNSGSILHNFQFTKPDNIESKYIDENDYRLQIAFCADGTIIDGTNKSWNGRIRVKKQYKKERLRKLLEGKNYKETIDGDYSIFWYNFTLKNKSLYECFKDEKWDILYEEVFKWDGNEKNKIFRTTKKEDADFIQFVIASFNKVSTIKKDERIGHNKILNGKEYTIKSILYIVSELKSVTTGLRLNKDSFIKVEYSKGENSYCFEVPSHNLVIRHDNKIFITGNCGKDLSKADVSVNIYCFVMAQKLHTKVEASCSIGDEEIKFKFHNESGELKRVTVKFSEIVDFAKKYIDEIGGFEKLAEWGLV